jgi:hypothetical protein
MEATFSSETSVDFSTDYTALYPKDRTLVHPNWLEIHVYCLFILAGSLTPLLLSVGT